MQHRCSTRRAAKDRIRDVTADRSPDDMGIYRTAPDVKDPELPLLQIRGVTVRFGPIVALSNVTFDVRRGEILGLIGPNGAGKTTLFNAMTGVYKPTSGDVLLEGQTIKGRKQHQITRMGLSRTFQNIRLFGEMT